MAKQGQIIIKKVKKGDHGGHHGGAWKVAYADFVTAMMAFFLLLWLLNVTTDVQKRGIADYFEPTISSKSQSGAGGVLGGTSIATPGSMSVPLSAPNFTPTQNALRQPNDGNDGDDGGSAGNNQDETDSGSTELAHNGTQKLSDEDLQKQLEQREEKRFQEAKEALEKAVNADPELKALAKNLMIDETPEGLRIQLVDQDKAPMFPLGSADMADPAKKLMSLVSQAIQKLPNKISITGHTDSTQYALGAKYTNWELSADRANATRREFLADGMPQERLSRVVGMADQDPIDKANPSDPQNRRISIVLLREAGDKSAQAGSVPASQANAGGSATPATATANGSAAAAIPLLRK